MTDCNKQEKRKEENVSAVGMQVLDCAVVKPRTALHYVELPNKYLGALSIKRIDAKSCFH